MFPFRDAQISVLCLPQEVAGFEELEPYDMCRQSLSLLHKDGVRGASYRTWSVVWCKSLCHCIILLLVINIGGVNIVKFWRSWLAFGALWQKCGCFCRFWQT